MKTKNQFIMGLLFLTLIVVVSSQVSSIQLPAGWWNMTTNMSLASNFNLTDDFNSTTGNLSVVTGGFLTILNSSINFTIGSITSNTGAAILVVNQSTISGTNNNVNNRLLINRNLNITIIHSFLRNLRLNELQGNGATNEFFVMVNSSLLDSDRLQSNNWAFVNITSSRFVNITTPLVGMIRIRSRINSYSITNNLFENGSGLGLEIFLGADNGLILNNTIRNTASHGVDNTDTNYTRVINNNIINVGGYGIDFHSQGSHAYSSGNTIVNATNGMIYSMGDGGTGCSFNLTSENNRIFNLTTSAQGMAFNTVINGTSSNDYIEGSGIGTSRGFSISTNVTNIRILNGTVSNILGTALVIQVISRDIYVENLTVSNAIETFNFRESNNVTIVNSLINSNQNHNGSVLAAPASTNYTFSNVMGHYFNWTSAQSLNFTLSQTYASFITVANVRNNISINNLNDALVYNVQTGQVYSNSEIANADGSVIILNLGNNNRSYVLKDFNVTEGISRLFTPISFTSSNPTTKIIASSLSQPVNSTVIFNVEECGAINKISVNGIQYGFGSYNCSSSIVTMQSVQLNPGNNEIKINAADADCLSSMAGYQKIGTLLGLVILIAMVGLAITILYFSPAEFTNENHGGVAVVSSIIIVAMIYVVGLMILPVFCSV